MAQEICLLAQSALCHHGSYAQSVVQRLQLCVCPGPSGIHCVMQPVQSEMALIRDKAAYAKNSLGLHVYMGLDPTLADPLGQSNIYRVGIFMN
jgi:hypothetical protein